MRNRINVAHAHALHEAALTACAGRAEKAFSIRVWPFSIRETHPGSRTNRSHEIVRAVALRPRVRLGDCGISVEAKEVRPLGPGMFYEISSESLLRWEETGRRQ
jgi:hypothetical protein